jgi:L-lysine 2,3-aminomutase
MMERAPASEGDTVAAQGERASGVAPGSEALRPSWQRLLGEAIRDPDELWRVLDLPQHALPAARASAQSFPVLAPRGFVALMARGDLDDPLLRQVVPLGDESIQHSGFVADPLGETGCAPTAGLLRKYHGRALLVATGACAVHCRYCFRRHFPYGDLPRGRRWWSDALSELAADVDLRELILSGGDPLTLPDAQLEALAADAAAVPHLERLRIHSRLPVVLPERVDDALLAWLGATRLKPVMVIHANHPNELSPSVASACLRLRDAGVTVLNQSVLLRGVNDEADALVALSERLFACGVMPYYLHALDQVAGSRHFLVDDVHSAELMRLVAARLPGYLVPRWVREVPGEANKSVMPW